MKINDQIIINAPPRFVFSALFNPVLRQRWDNKLIVSTLEYNNLINGESASLKFSETYREGSCYKKYQAELLHVFKSEYFSYKYLWENFDVIVEYSFIRKKNCTEVKRATEIIYKSWFAKLTASAISKTNRKCIIDELTNLKSYVENRLPIFV